MFKVKTKKHLNSDYQPVNKHKKNVNGCIDACIVAIVNLSY